MRVDLFDFDLPKDRIALRPAEPRDSARLLVSRGSGLEDRIVTDLPAMLEPGDCLVFNDTRVIPGRLIGKRGQGRVELTLHKQAGPAAWAAFAKPAKKCVPGTDLHFGDLRATVREKRDGGELIVDFDVAPGEMMMALKANGMMPLPPYIAAQRPVDARDAADYQTRFAQKDGAVAAPTASLHFTDRLMAALAQRGIDHEILTLHVGAGTFLPVKVEDTDDHKMHAEWGQVTDATAQRLNRVRQRGNRIIAVGTTVLRLLESAATQDRVITPFEGDTDIFISPGYEFRAIDGLMTNFHLPRSTLFMLVSALMGLDHMKAIYAHAIEQGYRFYSYGDSSLLIPETS